MAEFQWWLLLVGLVAGGGLVAVVTMDGRRREEDLARLERRAEAAWISERLPTGDVDPETVESILQLHREYLGLPPPDALLVDGEAVSLDGSSPDARNASGAGAPLLVGEQPSSLDRDPDAEPDDIGDDGGGGADKDLAAAREPQAAAGQEAHAGSDGKQRGDR
jgi:hypothetical protein